MNEYKLINIQIMSERRSAFKIYELPHNVNAELCNLLDHDDLWKKAAEMRNCYKGDKAKDNKFALLRCSAYEIEEIERNARNSSKSPTKELLSRWGEKGYNADLLVLVLYLMDNNPYMLAINCLEQYISEEFKKKVTKWQNKKNCVRNKHSHYRKDGNENRNPVQETSQSSLCSAIKLTENTPITNNKTCNTTKNIQQLAAIPFIEYEELKCATNNWDHKNLLGSGGFGQVFKGEWNYLTVAVKRLTKNVNNKELIREMSLNQYRHDNILPLYGYSDGGPESLLVYQLMTGGSLQDRLRCKAGRPPLTWPQRHRIAHGVARGLLFLHKESDERPPLIHGDIKPANILLDQCLTPKIGDFGLARKGPHGEERTHLKVSSAAGTRAYLPNEYLKYHHLSPAVDVFSYGVVMMEMATGLPAIDKDAVLLSNFIHQRYNEEEEICNLVSLEDKRIAGTKESNPILCEEFIKIGLHCTGDISDQSNRPSMKQVIDKLNSSAHQFAY